MVDSVEPPLPERRPSFSSSLPAVIVHKYSVQRQLSNNGAFGEIYAATTVAEKRVIDAEIRTFRENHKSFEELDTSDLDTLSQLSPHPNVARILDTVWNISSGGVELYLVTERCAGGDLAKFIEDHGAFTEIEVQDFLRQVTRGLGRLRELDIVHRDLRPPNILVDPGPIFKVADLTLAKLFLDDGDGLNGAVAFGECPTYIAPEVLRATMHPKTAPADNKVDLWSLGIMVLHCLNGEVPFHGSDLGQYSSDREIDVAGHIPRALTGRHLSDVIKGLLRFDPEDRPDFDAFSRSPFLKNAIWFAEPYRHMLPCNEAITSLCCDETDIVCGLESGLILVFDRKAFSLSKRLDFHRKTVSALAVNSEIIISGSQDTTIAVISRESYERLQLLYHHRNTVIGIEIIGSSAYSACLDGTHKAFSIDYKKLYARRNGFGGRRYSIQETSNEAFQEELEFTDGRSGKTYPAKWREHDHMHTVAGIIVALVYVAADDEFRPFHILSTRAFSSLAPQVSVRARDDALVNGSDDASSNGSCDESDDRHVRKLCFASHVRQVQREADQLYFLHWDGSVTLMSAEELLDPRIPNESLLHRTLVESNSDEALRPTWFCVQSDSLAFYHGENVTLLEYKL